MTYAAKHSSPRCTPIGEDPSVLSNHLLSALTAEDLQRLRPHLRAVHYAIGDVLCDEGHTFNPLIFPATAIVSMLCLTVDGDCAEVGVVGHDGVVGRTQYDATGPSPFRWVIQSAGAAYVLDDVAQVGDALAREMRRFTQALLAQVAQTAVCNRFHSIEQQLSRRLLMGLDRSQGSNLKLTHESVATLLGVRREGVTVAAQNLQREGLIKYRRGRIDVLDRSRLERHACECYVEAKTAYGCHVPQLPHGRTRTGLNPWLTQATQSLDTQSRPPLGLAFGANSLDRLHAEPR